MKSILAAIGAVWLVSAAVLAVFFAGAFLRRPDDAIEGCPCPDICPGCDGYLEFDDDGSNICPTCGSTWWCR